MFRVMNIRFLFLSVIVLLSVAACGNKTLAPVVHYGQASGAGSAGIHTVASGDTLYSLSKRYRLPMRDIVVLNRINPPFRLSVGQRIKLPPPQEYKVRQGDTLYGVSRLFGVNSSEVARLNSVSSPYVLRVGQVLRLPSVIRQNRAAVPVSKVARAKPLHAAPVKTSASPVAPPQASQSVVAKNGVPVPQQKPMRVASKAMSKASNNNAAQSLKVSKVTKKTPKRASSKFMKPINGKVLSRFGAKKSGLYNDGINIAAARGTPVKSAENGVVVYAGNALKGSGNLILVRHDKQWMSAYAHLDSIGVRKGQVIKRGSMIGKVGSTGSVSTPQLHFELRRGTSALNPLRYM